MTQNLLVNLGEEYMIDQAPDGASHDWGLYNDATAALGDGARLSDVTGTEPSNSNYARQTSSVSTSQLSGDYGWNNDSQLSFDFSDQTASENIDTAFEVANWTASITGDGGATDHIIANPALQQTRDIGSIDTLNVAAGDAQVTVN